MCGEKKHKSAESVIQGNLVSAQVRRGMMTLTWLHYVWFILIYSYLSLPW